MKHLTLFLIIILTMISCNSNSQGKLDLYNEVLQAPKQTIESSGVMLKGGALPLNKSYTPFVVESEVLLNFQGLDVSGYIEKGKPSGTNEVILQISNTDSLVHMYILGVYQTEKSEQLIQRIEEVIGKPACTIYRSIEKRKEGDYAGKVWIDDATENAFFLERKPNSIFYGQNVMEIVLYATKKEHPFFFEYLATTPPFGLFGDFVKFKKRFDKPEDFSYTSFVEEKIAKGNEKYKNLTTY